MNTQEAYEAIRTHFTQEGVLLAWNEKEYRCEYRTEDGRKCAVGVLIPDELYDPKIEGDNVWGLVQNIVSLGESRAPELKELLNGDDEEGQRKLSFLLAAQRAHDIEAEKAIARVGEFVEELDEIAESFGLEVIS